MADPVLIPTGLSLGDTVMQPGVIWSCGTLADGVVEFREGDLPRTAGGFRWLHLNLADQRSLRGIERSAALPPAVLALMLSHDPHPRLVVAERAVGLVLQDFERDFDTVDDARTGALHVAMAGDLVPTGRRHPVVSADLARRRIAPGGHPADTAARWSSSPRR